jgi:phosphotransacetylase
MKMNAPILLAVEADDHYIEQVAARAADKGLISGVRVSHANAEAFAAAIGRLDKSNLIIAKGMLETADFLRLILKYNDKELIAGGAAGFLSHCTILSKKLNWFYREKPLVLTDAAINIQPDAAQKVKIVKNAIDLTRRLFGKKRHVVSILTPAGKLNPAIKSSVDGDFVIRELAGENAEIRLDQLDTALSADARAAKGLPAGGTADILLADNLDSGNEIYKLHTIRAGYLAAGIVCGANIPIVLNSRADAPRSKLLSIKYAAKMLSVQR